jgi:transcriptional regulator with XRE-family HTH domain
MLAGFEIDSLKEIHIRFHGVAIIPHDTSKSGTEEGVLSNARRYDGRVDPTDDQVRVEMRRLLDSTGLSRRQLSLAMGRDPGYVSAFLDEQRHPRAIPTPMDLGRLSDETGIPFVELLERFWGIPAQRLADDLSQLSVRFSEDERLSQLTADELREVLDFAGYLVSRRGGAGEG